MQLALRQVYPKTTYNNIILRFVFKIQATSLRFSGAYVHYLCIVDYIVSTIGEKSKNSSSPHTQKRDNSGKRLARNISLVPTETLYDRKENQNTAEIHSIQKNYI